MKPKFKHAKFSCPNCRQLTQIEKYDTAVVHTGRLVGAVFEPSPVGFNPKPELVFAGSRDELQYNDPVRYKCECGVCFNEEDVLKNIEWED